MMCFECIYKGGQMNPLLNTPKIKDMSDRTELLQEKADDLERVKRYAGAEQIDMIIRKVKEQERTEQQIRWYDRSYGTR